MPKPEWGRKRQCASCGIKFYDMQRSPIICPSCGATFDIEAVQRPRRSRAARPHDRAPAKAVAGAEVREEAEEEVFNTVEEDEDTDYEAGEDKAGEEDDEDYELIEDASELGEDDDFADVSDDKDDEER